MSGRGQARVVELSFGQPSPAVQIHRIDQRGVGGKRRRGCVGRAGWIGWRQGQHLPPTLVRVGQLVDKGSCVEADVANAKITGETCRVEKNAGFGFGLHSQSCMFALVSYRAHDREEPMAQTFFAITSPGLEAGLMAELRALGAKKCQTHHGGVSFRTTRAKSYHILQNIRQANRLYLRVDEFRARDIFELYRKVKRIDWAQWLNKGAVVDVDASMHKSQFSGTGEVASKVYEGIRDSMDGQRVTQGQHGDEVYRVLARVEESRCTLSLDMAGKPLYIRGWRPETGRAPLRETTANSLLNAMNWSIEEPLIDPMCGSGTFLIEAALQAMGRSPRNWSCYAVEQYANFDQDAWVPVPQGVSTAKLALYGLDKNDDVLNIAQRNANRAAVDDRITWGQREVEHLSVPRAVEAAPSGVVICNPPFNQRLDRSKGRHAPDQQLLHRFARSEFANWRLGVLLPADFSIEHPKLTCEVLLRFRAGGMKLHFWHVTHAESS